MSPSALGVSVWQVPWRCRGLIFACLVLTLPLQSDSYNMFTRRVPNGRLVKNPYNKNQDWLGFGHCSPSGGGVRNTFGNDFYEAGMTWTKFVCRLDSDGDGITNGEELGDPNCEWSEGDEPVGSPTGHPGICEPVFSDKCELMNDFLAKTGTVCDHTNVIETKCDIEKDARPLSIRLTDTFVPPVPSSLYCAYFAVPKDPHHIVAVEPVLHHKEHVHHMKLHGCRVPAGVTNWIAPEEARKEHENSPFAWDQRHRPYDCGLIHFHYCRRLISAWTLGHTGDCFPPDAGVLIGGESGYTHMVMEMHWMNNDKALGVKDSSGVQLWITPHLRPHNMALLSIGQLNLQIPPGLERVENIGTCTNSRTREILAGDIKLVSAMHHMHSIGHFGEISLKRQNGTTEILHKLEYSQSYTTWKHFPKHIDFSPGDELSVLCAWTSRYRKETIIYGRAPLEEMCYGYLFAYPAEHILDDDCNQFDNVNINAIYDDRYHNGCDLENFRIIIQQAASYLATVCSPSHCKKDCYTLLYQLLPAQCMSASIINHMKTVGFNCEHMHFWSALEMVQPCVTKMPSEFFEATRIFQEPGKIDVIKYSEPADAPRAGSGDASSLQKELSGLRGDLAALRSQMSGCNTKNDAISICMYSLLISLMVGFV